MMFKRYSFTALISLCACAQAADFDTDAAFEMPLEQLMNTEVTTASKFPQSKMDAPAAVTVITADDIKDYGYTTLADVLRSIRGINMTYDRVYQYIGVRGFGRSGDYNARILLMIDGRRINDDIYDQAYVGTEGLVDLENVARIEFVPGSGSALYGSNAFFGVLNVITKTGKSVQGAEVAGGFASYGSDRQKGTVGYQFDNGADLLLSASRLRSDGQSRLAFNQFSDPSSTSFVAHELDGSKTDRLFGKFSYQGWELEGAFSSRSKSIPIALYGSDIDTPESYRDRTGFAEARYEKVLNDRLTAQARAYWGFYDFDGRYLFGGVRNLDVETSQWWGTEVKGILQLTTEHKLVFGSEYQSNFTQKLTNYDESPYNLALDIDRSTHRYGFYLQDEYSLTSNLTLNAGARYDYYSISGGAANPRVGLIYKPWSEIALKILYGTAFRAPNLYERFFNSVYQSVANNLKPEQTESVEAIVEYQATRNWRLTASAFDNSVTDLINLVTDPNDPNKVVYTNNQQVQMQGLEFESEYRWDHGTRLRSSYTFTYAKDLGTGRWLENSPRHLGKLNASIPLWRDQLRAGFELQYVGDRRAKTGMAPGYALTNLTLTAAKIVPNLEVSASVYNLLDKRYSAVAGEETALNYIPQDGRNFRVWFNYRY